MTFKDRVRRATDDAIAKATSDDVREKANALSSSAQKVAREFAESDAGQKIIGTAKDSANEVLGHLAGGDSVSQATAKATKTQVDNRSTSRNKDPKGDAHTEQGDGHTRE